jgi:hypothetical protein
MIGTVGFPACSVTQRRHWACSAGRRVTSTYRPSTRMIWLGMELVTPTTTPAATEAVWPVVPLMFKSRLADAKRDRDAAPVGTLKTPIRSDYISEKADG